MGLTWFERTPLAFLSFGRGLGLKRVGFLTRAEG